MEVASSFIFSGFVLTILFGIFINTHGGVISVDEQQCIFARRDPQYKDFYPLSKVSKSKIDGFKVIVRVAVTSEYGFAHILLSESNDAVNINKGYEFALSPWDDAEIRRRENVYGKYQVVTKSDYNVKEYAPNVTHLEVSISNDGEVSLLDLTSNATFKDPKPFDVNFISFSTRSKFEFNCDYGVFTDKTPFIQTRCETIFGWREELFHPLTTASSSKPDGYQAKIDISMLSDYGDIHILLSETNDIWRMLSLYENITVIGDRYKTQSEIRRKNSINEAYDFVGRKVFPYNMKGRRSHLWTQISVSNDGVVSFKDIHQNLTFNYTDSQTKFAVNYITFGGYRIYPATYQINCMEAETKC